jgi:hypothetical protein
LELAVACAALFNACLEGLNDKAVLSHASITNHLWVTIYKNMVYYLTNRTATYFNFETQYAIFFSPPRRFNRELPHAVLFVCKYTKVFSAPLPKAFPVST